MRYLDCPHKNRLLVSSMRATKPRESYDIRVCADCGCFFVFAEKGGTYIDVHFTLNTAELVEAAGQYYASITEVTEDKEKTMSPEKELREKLAEYAHNAWAGWMRYMFSKSEFLIDGSVLIPPDLVLRWLRQTVTSYDDLPEREKDSGLHEADCILRLFPRSVLATMESEQ